MVATEPEAASLWCQNLPPEKYLGPWKEFPGDDTNYLVVDIGDERTDITAFHKINKNEIEEIGFTSVVECGKSSLEKEFVNSIEDIVGETVLEMVIIENPSSYSSLMENFRCLLERFSLKDNSNEVHLTIPSILLEDMKEALADSSYRDKIRIRRGKMKIDGIIVASWFVNTCRRIELEIKKTLDELEIKIETFLLVGTCAEYPSVQDNIQGQFPDVKLLVPESPNSAVVQGAVLIGQNTDYISSRVLRCTCGRRKWIISDY